MEVLWAASAEEDLETIVEYIARDNLDSALNMDALLLEAANGLGLFPLKGRPGRIPGTRELIAHEHYILVYLIAGKDVHIVALLHMSRQWPPVKN